MILNRLTRWALRTAARRWPDGVRDDLHQEWLAELAHLESRPGTAGQRLGFALSLLTAPPVRDAAGVPRGWAETRSGMSPAASLIIAALLGLGVLQLTRSLVFPTVEAFGVDVYTWLWPHGLVLIDSAVLTLWTLPVAWWLGRHLPMARDGRLGVAGPAVLAPLAMLPALLARESAGDGRLIPTVSTVLGVLAWTILTALLGRAAVHAADSIHAADPVATADPVGTADPVATADPIGTAGPFGIAGPGSAAGPGRSRTAGLGRFRAVVLLVAGVPLVAVAAAALATVPLLIRQGADAAVASLLLSQSEALQPDGDGWLVYTGELAGPFVAFGWMAVLYGLRAATAPERPIRITEPLGPPAETARPVFSPVVLGAGVIALLGGVLAWAYTLTYLTPAMPVMAENAPMPGGDGEIYLWVAELRWTAILLAALGTLIATANRRSGPRAAILLAVGLLATQSILLFNNVTGAPGLRIALLAAAAVIAAGWTLAGPALGTSADSSPGTSVGSTPGMSVGAHLGAATDLMLGRPAGTVFGEADARVIRARTTAAAIASVALGPLLYLQATPPENHPFMPLGLPVTTVGLAAGLVLLGMVTAVATSAYRLHPAVIVLLVVVPAGVLASLGVYLGNGVQDSPASFGMVLGLPYGVVVTAVLRRHRPRRRGRTALVWTSLVIGAVPVGVGLIFAAMMPMMFAPQILFQIDGTGYPADGISVVPGAALLLVPAAIWLAGRSGGAPTATALPDPATDPDPATGPDSAATSPDPVTELEPERQTAG